MQGRSTDTRLAMAPKQDGLWVKCVGDRVSYAILGDVFLEESGNGRNFRQFDSRSTSSGHDPVFLPPGGGRVHRSVGRRGDLSRQRLGHGDGHFPRVVAAAPAHTVRLRLRRLPHPRPRCRDHKCPGSEVITPENRNVLGNTWPRIALPKTIPLVSWVPKTPGRQGNELDVQV